MTDRSNFGATADIISRITDANQLQAMLKSPQYAGFTAVIIARLTEINRMRQGPQGAQQPQPSVAQQAMTGQAPPQQAMARGGIVAFKAGGKIKKIDELKREEYSPTRGFADGGYVPPEPGGLDLQPHRTSFTRTLRDISYGGQPGYEKARAEQMRADAEAAASAADQGIPAQQTQAPLPETAQAPAATLPPQRLVTAREMGYSPMTAGISSLMSSSGGSRPERSLADYTGDIRAAMGENTATAEERANIKADKDRALSNALMYAGLGMARGASENPRAGILGNIATGATEGLTSYDKQAQARQQQLRDLGRTERAERMGLVSAAVGERGQDIRADRQNQLQRMGLGLQAQALRGPALTEQAVRTRAIDLANSDIDPQTGRPRLPLSAYHLRATQEYSSQLGIAGMRGETADRATLAKIYNEAEKLNPGSGARAVQMYQMQVQGAGDTSAGKNYGAL